MTAKLYRRVYSYFELDGKRVAKTTPGSVEFTSRPVWRGRYQGRDGEAKYVDLLGNRLASEKIFEKLVRDADQQRAGMLATFDQRGICIPLSSEGNEDFLGTLAVMLFTIKSWKKKERIRYASEVNFFCDLVGRASGWRIFRFNEAECYLVYSKPFKWYIRKISSRAASLKRERLLNDGRPRELYDAKQVYVRDNWICKICGLAVRTDEDAPRRLRPSIDHITPIARGGADTLDNLQCAHRQCNSKKGARADFRCFASPDQAPFGAQRENTAVIMPVLPERWGRWHFEPGPPAMIATGNYSIYLACINSEDTLGDWLNDLELGGVSWDDMKDLAAAINDLVRGRYFAIFRPRKSRNKDTLQRLEILYPQAPWRAKILKAQRDRETELVSSD